MSPPRLRTLLALASAASASAISACTLLATFDGRPVADAGADGAIADGALEEASVDPTLLAAGQGSARAIVTDARSVYWATFTGGAVLGCPQDGCGAGAGAGPRSIASGQASPLDLAVTATEAWFLAAGTEDIRRAPLDGTKLDAVVHASGQFGASAIALSASAVFWTVDPGGAPGDGKVRRCPLASCTGSTPVATGLAHPVALAFGPSALYFATGGDGAVGGVYACPLAEPLTCATPTLLATGLAAPGALAAEADAVYVTTSVEGGSVLRAVPGAAPFVVASGQSRPRGLAVGGGFVYWANRGDGTVRRARTDGSDGIVLASGQRDPYGVALGASRVFWTNAGDGTVHALAR